MSQIPFPVSDRAPTIEVDNVTVIYNNGHRALEEIGFSLEGGTVCALIGVNGSGKSTLFNSIMGIVRPQQGRILLNGLPARKAIKKNGVAYVPQIDQIDWRFPILVDDVVMQGRFGYMGFMRRASTNDRKSVDAALERMAIADLARRQIGELSGGQKKRVFLARALAQESRTILLDEPFTGIDVKTELTIMELLQSLRDEGYLILVSTHNIGSVPDYCNEVLMLDRRLVAAGDTAETFTQKNLAATFGGILKNVRLERDSEEPIHIVSDDERAAVFYGQVPAVRPHHQSGED